MEGWDVQMDTGSNPLVPAELREVRQSVPGQFGPKRRWNRRVDHRNQGFRLARGQVWQHPAGPGREFSPIFPNPCI
jgi:hypothetical protein